MPIQQMLLGVGAKKKTYMDDLFSTYVYTGTGSSRSINTGVDMSKGGLVWIKDRDSSVDHNLYDTVRGVGKYITSNTDEAEDTSAPRLDAFNSNGFGLGGNSAVNGSGTDFTSWSFRKAKGFFDVVTYTGNGSNRTIAHSLGSVPGFYMIKRTDATSDWLCFHREFVTGNHYMVLNSEAAMVSESDVAQNTRPTSSVFSVGTDSKVNADGGTYVCYLFAGGESTAATARSVDFDSSGDYLSTSSSSSDYTMGTGDFTIECWVKKMNYTGLNTNNGVCHISSTSGGLNTSNAHEDLGIFQNSGVWKCWAGGATRSTNIKPVEGVWTHLALVRHNNVSTLYVNGVQGFDPVTDNNNYDGTYIAIAGYYSTGNYLFDGKISNFRVVKGTAVYTTAFKPPTEPLTNITNTKLLCCNDSSTTGSTVTPVTINANGDPTASIDSPFDDPAAFKFGENEDQNVIKCGGYIGNGDSNDPPEVYLGFEPSWLLIKNRSSNSTSWQIFDVMRGLDNSHTQTSSRLKAESDIAEGTSAQAVKIKSTGFIPTGTGGYQNSDGDSFVYIAIRRPDGYVGKPVEVGTEVFAMDTGNGSTTIPAFDSGFPIDMLIFREPDTNGWSWNTGTRLMGQRGVWTNLAAESSSNSNMLFDSNVGTGPGTANWLDSDQQAWMWKRHAGFDVVTWDNTTSIDFLSIPHSLGKKPEMIWLKDLDNTNTAYYQSWKVWHSGLTPTNSVLNSEYIVLNTSAAQTNSGNMWSTSDAAINDKYFAHYSGIAANNSKMVAMLFATTAVSKIGSYTGNNSSSGPTVTTGFSPRFILIKRASGADNWFVFDTLRGITNGGNDARLKLDENGPQTTNGEWLSTSSTGFTLNTSDTGVNASSTYIYYAHA